MRYNSVQAFERRVREYKEKMRVTKSRKDYLQIAQLLKLYIKAFDTELDGKKHTQFSYKILRNPRTMLKRNERIILN